MIIFKLKLGNYTLSCVRAKSSKEKNALRRRKYHLNINDARTKTLERQRKWREKHLNSLTQNNVHNPLVN